MPALRSSVAKATEALGQLAALTAVAAHPWLATATRYCLATMAAQGGPAHTLELLYGLRFLDALAATGRGRGFVADRRGLGCLLP